MRTTGKEKKPLYGLRKGRTRPFKTCLICGRSFDDNRRNKYCSAECLAVVQHEKQKLWRQNNRQRHNESKREWKRTHREACRAYSSSYWHRVGKWRYQQKRLIRQAQLSCIVCGGPVPLVRRKYCSLQCRNYYHNTHRSPQLVLKIREYERMRTRQRTLMLRAIREIIR